MAYRDPATGKAYNAVYRKRADVRRRQQAAKRAIYEDNRRRAIALKGGRCVDCGNANLVHLQFDHLQGGKRTASYFMRKRWSQELEDELAKCDFVCANCHTERTYQRRVAQR